jgi:hypothetical protein
VRIWNVGFVFGLVASLMVGTIPALAAPPVLITPEEAALPPPKGAVATERRGITRGPKVDVVTTGALKSPARLQVKFEPYGGAKVDPDSVKMIYLRTPNVDLTSRIKAFILPTGIDMPEVQLPAGEHMVRVDIKDSDGRVGTASFILKVVP